MREHAGRHVMMDARIRNPEDSEHNFGYFIDFGGNYRFLYFARSKWATLFTFLIAILEPNA